MGGDANERIDRALDWLDAAIRAAGFDGLEPAPDPEAVDRLDGELAPYSLPPDLRRLWERIDFPSLSVLGSYLWSPESPESAREAYRMNREEFPDMSGPPLLFPISGASGLQCTIELASASRAGGWVVSNEDQLRVEYPSLTDLVEVYAELIEAGCFSRTGGRYGSLNDDDERERQEERLQAAGVDDVFAGRRDFDFDPSDWPQHWLESAGIALADRVPLGATHTIAELVEASAAGVPLAARIAGEVVHLVGMGSDTLVVVDDGTGTLDVWCPAGVKTWFPGNGVRFEFEVAVDKLIGPPIDVRAWHREFQSTALDGLASGGRMEDAAAVVRRMTTAIDQRRPVVATGIRPLD